MQKKWSHIDPQLFSPLDEKEVSLKVNGALFTENGFKHCHGDGDLSGVWLTSDVKSVSKRLLVTD